MTRMTPSRPSSTLPEPQQFVVRFHPDGALSVGDLISIDISASTLTGAGDQDVEIRVLQPVAQDLGKAHFYPGADGRQRAILQWGWKTNDLLPGTYILQFDIPSLRITWNTRVELTPERKNKNRFTWQTVETDCCSIHYISNTDAAEDIKPLQEMIDAQYRDAAHKLNLQPEQLKKKVHINLIPRLLGQGGFASDEIYISYSRQNYINTNMAQLIHHELVHRLDSDLGGQLRPTFFVEGLAVYLSSGHYQQEPVLLKLAALDALGTFIPLAPLMDDFYPRQHESGYLEAGGLIEYMVQVWGWDRFNTFYRNIPDLHQPRQSASIDAAMQTYYNLSLQEMEQRFHAYLNRLPVIPDLEENLQLTIDQFDIMRQYQKTLDPSAFFQTVWLPDARQMREKGIVADYLYGPDQPINAEMESILYKSGEYVRQGEYEKARAILEDVQLRIRRSNLSLPDSITASVFQIPIHDLKSSSPDEIYRGSIDVGSYAVLLAGRE